MEKYRKLKARIIEKYGTQEIFLKYSKTSPIEKRKLDRYQPELRNPVAIPLMVVWINFS